MKEEKTRNKGGGLDAMRGLDARGMDHARKVVDTVRREMNRARMMANVVQRGADKAKEKVPSC